MGACDCADRGGVQAGHDQGAAGTALQQGAALAQGIGQVGLLYGPDPDTRGGVAVDELLGAGVEAEADCCR